MKQHLPPKLPIALLLISIITASCNGSDKTPHRVASTKNMNPDPHTIASTSADSAFQHSNIRCIFQDKSGNLWFASNGDGVCRHDPAKGGVTYFTENEGLCSNYMQTIVEDSAGDLWFCSDYGICRFDGTGLPTGQAGFSPFTEQGGRCDLRFSNAIKDKNGNLWFSTDGGACRYDPAKGGFTHVSIAPKEHLRTPFAIYCLFEDNAGNIWFGTQNSVCRYDPDTGGFAHFKEKGLDRVVRSIIQDKNGTLWFASNGGGVCTYDGTSLPAGQAGFSNFSEEKGLSHNLSQRKLEDETQLLNRVFCMAEDHAGYIWFGTIDEGVWRYDGVSMTNFTVRDGLSSNAIWSILVDRSGKLWVGTAGGGVCKFDGRYFVPLKTTAVPL